MTKTNASQNLLPKILPLCFVIFSLNFFCFAQGKADLEIKGRSSVDVIRGGEKLNYTFTVTNLSPDTAKDVHLAHDLAREAAFISATVSQGSFETDATETHTFPRRLWCHFGDIQGYAEATVTIEIKLNDWGDISSPNNPYEVINKFPLREFADKIINKQSNESQPLQYDVAKDGIPFDISYPDIVCDNCDRKEEQFARNISIKLLPSKNIPPRIEIVSPKYESVIIKSVKEPLEIPVVIKAFDLDGKIKRVSIPKDQFQITYEDNAPKYVIEGKTYTVAEIQNNRNYFRRYFETDLESSGKDTYTFVLKNLKYGNNVFFVDATDDGGRESSARLEFTIKSDATIEILTPKNEQVFTPNSRIVVETTSKISDGIAQKLFLRGTKEFYSDVNPPIMQQVSKVGNIYKHQFVWKNLQEGFYDLKAVLFENGLETSSSDSIRIIIAEPRIIKISSLKNGQEFEQGKPIRVSVETTDIKGEIVHDGLELFVDGKSHGRIYNSWTTEQVPPYNKKILDKSIGYNLYLEKGVHTIQVIAKQHEFTLNGATLGKSEIITIKVN